MRNYDKTGPTCVAEPARDRSEISNRLTKAGDAYNNAVATLECRVLVSARRLRDLKAAPDEDRVQIKVIEPVDRAPRAFQMPALSSMLINGDKQ